jgi:hypothetical protein
MDELSASQRYYQTHKDERKAYGRKYYQENRDKILESVKERKKVIKQASNPEINPPVLVTTDVSGVMVSFS